MDATDSPDDALRKLLIQAARSQERGPLHRMVLNGCRVLRYLADRSVVTREEGERWALAHWRPWSTNTRYLRGWLAAWLSPAAGQSARPRTRHGRHGCVVSEVSANGTSATFAVRGRLGLPSPRIWFEPNVGPQPSSVDRRMDLVCRVLLLSVESRGTCFGSRPPSDGGLALGSTGGSTD